MIFSEGTTCMIGDHGGMKIFTPIQSVKFALEMKPGNNAARRPWNWLGLMATLSLSAGVPASIPMERVPVAYLAAVQSVVKDADFTFETTTKPARVRFETMEKLFDHPALAAAMWRHCRFVPSLYAFELPGRCLTVDDGKGLRGTLFLVHHQPGMRIYYIEGRVEKGRMKNPFAVGAKMVVVYRYWKGAEGFQSHLNTWTALDSAVLSLITRPFRSYIRFRQEEFIDYITMNISHGGEFAQMHPEEFRDPIKLEGDPVAIRQFSQVFSR
jgi:hypothetical protein